LGWDIEIKMRFLTKESDFFTEMVYMVYQIVYELNRTAGHAGTRCEEEISGWICHIFTVSHAVPERVAAEGYQG
jgi:hypothetical protein